MVVCKEKGATEAVWPSPPNVQSRGNGTKTSPRGSSHPTVDLGAELTLD